MMAFVVAGFAKRDEQMAGVVPGKAEFLLVCHKVILPVMYLEIFIAPAMHTTVHVAVEYFFPPGFPVRVKQ